MLVYMVSSMLEEERKNHITDVAELFPLLQQIEAVYPNRIKIPFYSAIKSITKSRTGIAISDGALGCLLSHRRVWSTFLHQDQFDNCLILESDSDIVNLKSLNDLYSYATEKYDLFFWGAFDGRMKLFKSTIKQLNNYTFGEPYKNSLYCTYGYSINKKAAAYLLKKTTQFNYPVDYWKYRLNRKEINIGGILPNLIITKTVFTSTIYIQSKTVFNKLFDMIIDFKNYVITFFN